MRSSPNPINIHIGNRIRLRRLALGISQQDLAEAIGLSFQQVQKYEKGFNRCGGERIAAVAAALDVPPSWFFEGLSADDAPAPSAVDTFMATADGVMIANALVKIANPEVRHTIARFVADLAQQRMQAAE